MKPIFITGIGTDVGKTVISAILVKALAADYWKPIQAGDLDNTDTMKVQAFVNDTATVFHPEAYRLNTPASPHLAAANDGLEISIDKITNGYNAIKSHKPLLIEGAGGLMVPLNKTDLVIDLIKALNVEVILVSRNYLGSINHTLLSFEALKQKGIPVKGIIFNGKNNPSSEEFILNYTGLPCLLRVNEEPEINADMVKSYAQQLNKNAF